MPTQGKRNGIINLKGRFGKRYRIDYGESYHVEHGKGTRVDDPYLQTLLCKFGHIYAWEGDTLAASVDGHPNIANRLRRLKCCRVHQDGDFGELTALFDVADFAKVARILRPRQRRQVRLSAKQRQVIGERLRRGREKARQTVVQNDSSGRPCVSTAQDDQIPVRPQSAHSGR